MANYSGFISNVAGLSNDISVQTNVGISDLVAINIQYMGTNLQSYSMARMNTGERKTKHLGITPTSSVTVIDIMQINGPRVFPLEISWKKAATS